LAHARRHCRQLALTGPAPPARAGVLLAALLAVAATARAEPPVAYAWHLPRGFQPPAVPADNPMSQAKVDLGERLFFDTRLSVTGRYSCASCHQPARAFSDGRALAVGATGATLPHNALALVNVAYSISLGWTRREPRTLEAQMLEPMLNEHPVELGLRDRERGLCQALAAEPGYVAAFSAAFGAPGEAAAGEPCPAGPVTFIRIVRAIAAFERTLISGGSAFDRYVFGGEHEALPVSAKRGMALFFSARVGCAGCHSGINFAGNWRDAQGATGDASFAVEGTSVRAVRVPTLRNVALTAPYMHDGRFATLDAVLAHYSQLGTQAARGMTLDPRLPRTALTAAERADLVAFLDSLTDSAFVSRFAAPGARAAPADGG
ncbi:MAG TPA: cytochrome c peroxidase, partial [Steroidobacteraceae bacterium]|nr:cytochrome c peroxidase [Steroidobacteraceae bacterium]